MRLRVYVPEGISDWESDVALFRVGRADSCALRFEGALAKYSGWEHAEFTTDDQGRLYITDLESKNGTYIDGVRIAEPTLVQVGAIVQIGTKGAKLEVLEVAPPAQDRIAVVTSKNPPTATWQQRGLAIGLAVALVIVVCFFLLRKGGGDAQEQLAKNGGGEEKPSELERSPPVVPLVDVPREKPEPPTPPPVPVDPWKVAKETGLPAYRLIAIEDPKTQRTWPLAGAVIVAPQALLTTADVGKELAKFQAQEMNIKILRDSQDTGMPVDRVRIYDAFQKAKPEEQLYFDLAIVSTKELLTGAAKQASAPDLAAIELGQPLACVSIDHTGEPINRFQQLQPEWQVGKVFNLTTLSSEAGAPRVLHLRGAFSDKSWGSPIFNDRGQLMALYCEPGPDDGGPPERAVHFAALIEPQIIELGLSQTDHPFWVAPVPPDPPSKQEPAK